MRIYKFAEEFTKEPGPRFRDLGKYSGEEFREDVLEKMFENNEVIEIDVTNVILTFGPSFLSESFGKTAVKIGKKKFFELVKFKDSDEENKRFKKKVEQYVDNALKKAG